MRASNLVLDSLKRAEREAARISRFLEVNNKKVTDSYVDPVTGKEIEGIMGVYTFEHRLYTLMGKIEAHKDSLGRNKR